MSNQTQVDVPVTGEGDIIDAGTRDLGDNKGDVESIQEGDVLPSTTGASDLAPVADDAVVAAIPSDGVRVASDSDSDDEDGAQTTTELPNGFGLPPSPADPYAINEEYPSCLDFNHSRLEQIDELEDPKEKITRLYLRWNQIKKIQNLDRLRLLCELDLYDNQITVLENLEHLQKLEILDVSFNRIRTISNLSSLVSLKKLYLCANKISKIENLEQLTSLQMLELGDCKIRQIENLESLTNLTELYLGKNKINQIRGLTDLVNLRILSLQSNRLTNIEGLETLVKLEQLYLSANAITKMEGFSTLRHLQTLDLANNQLKSIEGIKHLYHLEEFWINNNLLSDWSQLDNINQVSLQTIYLEHNPLWQGGRDPNYRRKVKLALPRLTQIDATLCR